MVGWRRRAVPGLVGQAGKTPLGPAVLEAAGAAAGRSQAANRLVRVDAVGAAAVGDHLRVVRNLGQTSLELVERHRSRALDMSGSELDPRADVDDHDLAAAKPLGELGAPDRLDLLAEVVAGGALHVAQACLGDIAQRKPERDDVLACRPVVDACPLAPRSHEPGSAQHLKMLGGVGHGQSRRLGELLHRALPLGQHIQHHQARGAAEGVADPRELLKELLLVSLPAHEVDSINRLISWSSRRATAADRRCAEALHPRAVRRVTMTTARRLDTTDLEARVKDMYREVAEEPQRDFHFEIGRPLAERLGYPPADLDRIPAAAIDSFAGVGFYFDLAAIRDGETVLDLGSGSGTDSFIASLHAGPGGRVIGVNMTDAQLDKASTLAREAGTAGIEFRKGYIESPPVEPGSVDCVISNGVINLSADKPAVFAQAVRALRPGGRLALADIVTAVQLPEGITCDAALWAACIGGAMQRDRYREAIEAAGFEVLELRENVGYRFISDRASNASDKYGVTSISLLAEKR